MNYQKERERVKVTNTQRNKSKSAAKNKKGAILRLNMKNVEDEEVWHELFVTTRQLIITWNAIANSISIIADILHTI